MSEIPATKSARISTALNSSGVPPGTWRATTKLIVGGRELGTCLVNSCNTKPSYYLCLIRASIDGLSLVLG
jgi:hypothetical protein